MKNVQRFGSLLGTILTLSVVSASSAEFKVSSATFQPTDNTIAISVNLENNSSSILSLAAFSFQLQVTSVSSTMVEFDTLSQPNTLSNSDYIFTGNSAAQNTPFTPWAVSSVSGKVNNNYVFSDTTDDTFNISIPAGSSKLLANIILKPATGSAAPQSGDVYNLSFITAGTSLFDDTLNSVAFTTGSGTLSVPTSVPEPSTYAMAMVAVLMLLRKLWPKTILA